MPGSYKNARANDTTTWNGKPSVNSVYSYRCVHVGSAYPVKATAVDEYYIDFSNCKESSGQTEDKCINCIYYGEIVINKFNFESRLSIIQHVCDTAMACCRLIFINMLFMNQRYHRVICHSKYLALNKHSTHERLSQQMHDIMDYQSIEAHSYYMPQAWMKITFTTCSVPLIHL